MEKATIIGIDLAKRVFQVHGAAQDGRPVFRKKVSRAQLLGFLAKQSPAVVAMEACATAHGWGRAISGLGHEVRLIPPIYVKPFVRRQTNDTADDDLQARTRLCCLARSGSSATHDWREAEAAAYVKDGAA